MLKFDADTLKLLDVSYRGSDITKRRMENMAALGPRRGESILDLGCGQGMMTEELARAVGPHGQIVGVDPSPDMRAEAEVRCASYANTRILDGSATSIPTEDEELDGAVSLQVIEYVSDTEGAFRELHRKLKPGGRLVIGDMQWGTLSWASDDPDRMVRMCQAWERHVAEPNIPAILSSKLETTGFQVLEIRPLPFSAFQLRPDSLPYMIMHLMKGYAVQNGLMPEAEANDWFNEQNQLADEGRFFFSLTHFIGVAIRR